MIPARHRGDLGTTAQITLPAFGVVFLSGGSGSILVGILGWDFFHSFASLGRHIFLARGRRIGIRRARSRGWRRVHGMWDDGPVREELTMKELTCGTTTTGGLISSRQGSMRTAAWRSRKTDGLYQCAMHICILYVRFMKDKIILTSWVRVW